MDWQPAQQGELMSDADESAGLLRSFDFKEFDLEYNRRTRFNERRQTFVPIGEVRRAE